MPASYRERGALGTSRSVDNLSSPRSPRTISPGGAKDRTPPGTRAGSPQNNTRALSHRKQSSPRRSKPDLLTGRGQENVHRDLYEDAFARSQRLEMMRHKRHELEEQQLQQELEDKMQRMKSWSRLYTFKGTRSHLEREEETQRRKQEKIAKLEAELRAKEDDDLRECTFQPSLRKALHTGRTKSPPSGSRSTSSRDPGAVVGIVGSVGGGGDPESKLRRLVERQHAASVQLQGLAQEEERLREHLRTIYAELHARIQREETQRVVSMLQDADAEGSTQRDLIQRVRQMVQSGDDPEVAQRQIVEELVSRSQDEVRRRVQEAYGPVRLEMEGDLYQRRLTIVHELESLEAQVIALRGGTLLDEARALGFEFGFAEKCRRSLTFMTPGSTQRVPTPPIIEEVPLVSSQPPLTARPRLSSYGSENSANAPPQLPPAREASQSSSKDRQPAGRQTTPRSQPSQAPSQCLSRQSSCGAELISALPSAVEVSEIRTDQQMPKEDPQTITPRLVTSSSTSSVQRELARGASESSLAGHVSPPRGGAPSGGQAAAAEPHIVPPQLPQGGADSEVNLGAIISSLPQQQASTSGQGSTPRTPQSPMTLERAAAAASQAQAQLAAAAAVAVAGESGQTTPQHPPIPSFSGQAAGAGTPSTGNRVPRVVSTAPSSAAAQPGQPGGHTPGVHTPAQGTYIVRPKVASAQGGGSYTIKSGSTTPGSAITMARTVTSGSGAVSPVTSLSASAFQAVQPVSSLTGTTFAAAVQPASSLTGTTFAAAAVAPVSSLTGSAFAAAAPGIGLTRTVSASGALTPPAGGPPPLVHPAMTMGHGGMQLPMADGRTRVHSRSVTLDPGTLAGTLAGKPAASVVGPYPHMVQIPRTARPA